MKVLKVDNGDNIIIRSGLTLVKFAETITKDMFNDSNENNKLFCLIASDIVSETNPKIYFSDEGIIYSLEFVAGKEQAILGFLKYDCIVGDVNSYLINLINDTHRKWEETTLTFDEDDTLTNQVLTLLRICKISKEDYLKDPSILSRKFTLKH